MCIASTHRQENADTNADAGVPAIRRRHDVKRVAIYGGTILEKPVSGFVGRLATALLEHTDAVLVTGGYDYSEDARDARSTDRSVADAAEVFAKMRRIGVATRLETCCLSRRRTGSRKKCIGSRKGECTG